MAAREVTDVLGFAPATWDVVSTLATTLAFLVAAIAALVAYRQLRLCDATRLDQNRPYVLVRVDNSPINFHLIDLVVENVGAGPARNVSLRIDPPLARVKEAEGYRLSESRLFSHPIPLLPPSFSLRTFFDSAIDRNGADLPSTHQVTISYSDGHGHSWTERSVLDFTLLEGLLFTESYKVHHVAQALQETNKILKRSRLLSGEAVNAVVESRDDYLARKSAEHEELEQQMAEFKRRAHEQRETQHDQGPQPDEE